MNTDQTMHKWKSREGSYAFSYGYIVVYSCVINHVWWYAIIELNYFFFFFFKEGRRPFVNQFYKIAEH